MSTTMLWAWPVQVAVTMKIRSSMSKSFLWLVKNSTLPTRTVFVAMMDLKSEHQGRLIYLILSLVSISKKTLELDRRKRQSNLKLKLLKNLSSLTKVKKFRTTLKRKKIKMTLISLGNSRDNKER